MNNTLSKYAVVFINRIKVSILLVDISNIDWLEKTVIDNNEIIESEYLLDEKILVYDTNTKRPLNIKVSQLLIDRHQLIINNKLYIPLHIINDTKQ